jgi:hypothetical protein
MSSPQQFRLDSNPGNGAEVTRSLLAKVYLKSHSLFRVIHGCTQVLFEGFWMGLLPDSVCDQIAQGIYGEGDGYESPVWLDSGLFFWEDLIVKRFFTPGCRVLVPAAGGGREIIALTRLGFTADGFECCRPMVVAGQRGLAARGISGKLEWAPPCEAPALDGVYDALIVGWNGYTYISPRRRRVEFLQTLRRNLKPNAPVLVSGAFASTGDKAGVWTPRIANRIRMATFRAPVFERGDTFPGHSRHRFTRAQIEGELREAGFTPTAFYMWGNFCAVVCGG